LARFDPRKAQVIELRSFGGLSLEETRGLGLELIQALARSMLPAQPTVSLR